MYDDDRPNLKLFVLLLVLGLGAVLAYQVGHTQGEHAESMSRHANILRESEETLTVLREQERARTSQIAMQGAED